MKITGGRGGAGRGGAFLGPRLPEPGLQGEEEGKCGAPCGEGGGGRGHEVASSRA